MAAKYTPNASKALKLAAKCARDMNQNYVGSEHLLAGLVREEAGVAARILAENGLSGEKITEVLAQLNVQGGPVELLDEDGYSPRLRRILEIADQQAKRYKSEKIGTEHLLLAVILEGENVALKLMESICGNPAKIYFEVIVAIGENPQQHKNDLVRPGAGAQSGESMLSQYSRDLTQMAGEGDEEQSLPDRGTGCRKNCHRRRTGRENCPGGCSTDRARQAPSHPGPCRHDRRFKIPR